MVLIAMTGIYVLYMAAILAQTSSAPDQRPPNPLAPSLRQITEAEQARFEAIIDRFVKYDTGKLTGAEGKKALADFNALPQEAIFALIEGFNRAANMEDSCPAVIIGKKIQRILNASDDLDLLAYAKETIGSEVTGKRHLGMMKDLQFSILLRRGAIQRKNLASGGGNKTTSGNKTFPSMSLAELSKAAEKEKGPRLKEVLIEIEKRQSPKVFDTLVQAARSDDKDIQGLGQLLLAKKVEKQSNAQLKDLLKHELTEVRLETVKSIASRKLPWGKELIDRLQDQEEEVRQAARKGLVGLSEGQDFGPMPNLSFGERETAVAQWRAWWAKQAKAKQP